MKELKKFDAETCLFDSMRGHVANSLLIHKLAQDYGWSKPQQYDPEEDDFNEVTDEALEWLNHHAVAEGFYIAFHDGDVMVLAEKNEEQLVDMRCNRCEAAMINGVYCHETGCPNIGKEKIDGEWVATCSNHDDEKNED